MGEVSTTNLKPIMLTQLVVKATILIRCRRITRTIALNHANSLVVAFDGPRRVPRYWGGGAEQIFLAPPGGMNVNGMRR